MYYSVQLKNSELHVAQLKRTLSELTSSKHLLETRLQDLESNHTVLNDKNQKDALRWEEAIGLLEYRVTSQQNDIERRDIIIKDLKFQLRKAIRQLS